MTDAPNHGSPCPACQGGTLHEWVVKRGPQLGKTFLRCDACDHAHFPEDQWPSDTPASEPAPAPRRERFWTVVTWIIFVPYLLLGGVWLIDVLGLGPAFEPLFYWLGWL